MNSNVYVSMISENVFFYVQKYRQNLINTDIFKINC